ncbi:MAG: hypothetical protein B7Y25_05030 [Alphaproteobacteria bacterium 16-39-46]|nr:MAG: hypothetical protein B7Y25_05030 [Alphaproteobacteria bacterium 16-39-46]OZA42820.1 MAG: hypothetical protein B7X84_04840 [Alphaproteobacteria bacterium 17-39-52]HQS84267.1 nucleotidyl transferase AbiEii/AbiGii toxin family protein [Alphaproteobacteria bacterium]HQS94117.1 nucleotidyl transferase AbiEii/AbiGii toxin family protein [Alphaproteobacteria bacterium]
MYEKQVSLLLDLIPSVASESRFALKGGTAINLFCLPMPRLSVDLDLVYLPLEGREEALMRIDSGLVSIKNLIQKRHSSLKIIQNPNPPELCRQLIFKDEKCQVKVEVNIVIRGTLYPVSEKPIDQVVQNTFKKSVKMQVVSLEDLYGSKICAALDRQHPRDLFDMMIFFQNHELSRPFVRAFLFYLLSHNRPLAEVLHPTFLDIKMPYERSFLGMTKEMVSLEALIDTREKLVSELRQKLTHKDKDFLISFKKGNPDWSYSDVENFQDFPSIKWKLKNIQLMTQEKRQKMLVNLEKILEDF